MKDQSRKLSEKELFYAYSRAGRKGKHQYLGQQTAGPIDPATGQHTSHHELERCKVCWEYDFYENPQQEQHQEEIHEP